MPEHSMGSIHQSGSVHFKVHPLRSLFVALFCGYQLPFLGLLFPRIVKHRGRDAPERERDSRAGGEIFWRMPQEKSCA